MRASGKFVLTLRWARLKSLPSDLFRKWIRSRLCCAKSGLQDNSEEDHKESWGEHAALFHPASNVEGLRDVAVELHRPLHVGVERSN